jgi:hypothetical protein
LDAGTLTDWIDAILESRWADAIYTFLIVFAVLVCNAVLKRVLGLFMRRAEDGKAAWQADLLDGSMRRCAAWCGSSV